MIYQWIPVIEFCDHLNSHKNEENLEHRGMFNLFYFLLYMRLSMCGLACALNLEVLQSKFTCANCLELDFSVLHSPDSQQISTGLM